MTRFVLLHHIFPPGDARASHWDLMLERGDGLLTWSLAVQPRAGCVIDARRLAAHRLAYFDYEGEVSGGRGRVSRFDRGDCAYVHYDGELVVADLAGQRLAGRVTLERVEGDRWRCRFDTQERPSPA